MGSTKIWYFEGILDINEENPTCNGAVYWVVTRGIICSVLLLSKVVWFNLSLVYWSDHMYVRTYSLYLGAWIYTRVKSKFIFKNKYLLKVNLMGSEFLESFPPCSITPTGSIRVLFFSEKWTAWGVPNIESVPSKNWEAYNLNAHTCFILDFF